MPVRLFVGNLPYDATEAELREHFGTIGPLASVFIPVDRETGRPRGFAFVEFVNTEHGAEAITRLNSQPFKGRPLSVGEARAREGRPGGGPGGGPPPRGEWSPRPPMRSGPSPGFGGPPVSSSFDARGGDRPRRDFGPDRPKKSAAKPTKGRREERAGGPIPIRGGGRIYDVDDVDDMSDLNGAPAADDTPFDDIAQARPDDDEGGA